MTIVLGPARPRGAMPIVPQNDWNWVVPSGGDAGTALAGRRTQEPSGAQNYISGALVQGSVVVTFAVAIGLGASVSTARNVGTLGSSPNIVIVSPARKREDDEASSSPSLASAGIKAPTSVSRASASELVSASDRLDTIQNAFSLSVTQLADVLHVTRPTIYAWRQSDVTVPRDTGHAKRLHQLYMLVQKWQTLSPGEMGDIARAPLGKGDSFLELLKADQWDLTAIGQAMDNIAQHLINVAAAHTRAAAVRNSQVTAESTAIEREGLRSLARRDRVRRR